MSTGARLRSRFSELASQRCLRAAVRIDCGGSVVLDAAYGEDGAGNRLMAATGFQIASISKTFAAAATLRLIEQRRLSLDDELAVFVDDAPAPWEDITIHHLLTHTSGLVHWRDVPGLDLHRQCTRRELIARFAATQLQFEPGSAWAYSSPGYALLAHIVEVVGGAPYSSFVTHELLKPLGLLETSVAEPVSRAGAATGSRAGEPVRSFDLGCVNVGAGDVWSTTAELARWPRLLAHSELFGAAARAAIFSPHAQIAEEHEGFTDFGYCYGWFTACRYGRRLLFHSGDQPGFSSLLVWAPDVDLVLVLLAADEIDPWSFVLPTLTELLTSGD